MKAEVRFVKKKLVFVRKSLGKGISFRPGIWAETKIFQNANILSARFNIMTF